MRFSDQHIHCDCSMDSHTSKRDMAIAARDRGMTMVTFTDHIDMDNEHTGEPRQNFDTNFPRCRKTHEEISADPIEGIEVRFGMELASGHHDPETAARAAAEPGLDLVLGSMHNLRGVMDFYWYPYSSEEECVSMNRRYLRELIELADYPFFDVMAHVGYTSRYMAKHGFKTRIETEHYGEELAELFKKLIAQGRGIEVNASGLYRGQTTYPEVSGLRLYKDLGGEIITVGSDAHEAKDASKGIKEACELLRSLGYKYFTEFRQRKAEFVSL